MAEVSKNDLELINKLSRKELTAEEVYIFPVVCCDNQIDRDYERFSDDALEEMAKLYVGQTIIKDHDPKTDNQAARVYRAQVQDDENGVKKLVAYAYVPVLDSTKDFIAEIETGLKKEVSVGCAVNKRICSVCGEEAGYCGHVPGGAYDGVKCYRTLSGVTDVYELSFVAVPAQKGAGVTKSFDVRKRSIVEAGRTEKKDSSLESELLELELEGIERENEDYGN